MTPADILLKTILQWAKDRQDVRTMILLGSRAQKRSSTDRLSDIDLCLFVSAPDRFLESPAWLTVFAPVWLHSAVQDMAWNGWKVIYENGVMVEFGVYPLDALTEMQNELPPAFEPGYKILLDKDKQARKLPKPRGQYSPPNKPTPDEFQKTFTDFWVEAYHVAKYLWRTDLWQAKHHDWALKQHLLTMLGWYAVTCRGQSNFTTYHGKHLNGWVDPELYISLMSIFGRFYPADSWRALDETILHFTRLAAEVAEALAFPDPRHLQYHFNAWVEDLKANPPQS